MKTTSLKGSDRHQPHSLPLIVAMLALFVLVPSCSKKEEPVQTGNSGKVLIRGSNTIGEELGPRLIAEYKKDHPAAVVEIESKGTGYGIAALLAGQCGIAAASRAPIKEELELAKERGIELNDYPIGAYSVAVVVNPACPIGNITTNQIRDIFNGTIQNWKEVGGADAAIHLCVRDPISGTYLGFRELAMENKHYASGPKTFTNYTGIVQAVAQDPSAIGYCSIGLASEPNVKALSVEGVAPSATSVKDGKYSYVRILRFYTNKAREEAPCKEFIQFVQSPKGQAILAETGNIPH
jgi:phosphate transport system substrate-binding protein